MCIPTFDCCVSELLCSSLSLFVMYGLRSFFVVLQVVQCLPIILAICIRAIGVYHLTKFHLSTPSSLQDSIACCGESLPVLCGGFVCMLEGR